MCVCVHLQISIQACARPAICQPLMSLSGRYQWDRYNVDPSLRDRSDYSNCNFASLFSHYASYSSSCLLNHFILAF